MVRKYTRYATKDKLGKVNPKNFQLVKKFFNFKNMNLSDASKKSYESDFNQWLVYIMENYDNEYILNMDIDDIADMIEDYIAFCSSVLENNERRIQRRMSSISSFFIYLRKKRKIRENPIDYLERPKVGKGEKPQIKQTFLTKEQVDDLRKALKKHGDLQLELFFEFGLSTMARANAIINVKLNQIDFENGVVNDVLEKEGYIVTLCPSKRCMTLIKQWLKYRKDNEIECEYLFVSNFKGEWKMVEKNTVQSSWIKKIGKMIDIPDLHCHDLRHSGSNLLYQSGVPLETVSNLLNHRSTQTTIDHYLKTDFSKIQDIKSQYDI